MPWTCEFYLERSQSLTSRDIENILQTCRGKLEFRWRLLCALDMAARMAGCIIGSAVDRSDLASHMRNDAFRSGQDIDNFEKVTGGGALRRGSQG